MEPIKISVEVKVDLSEDVKNFVSSLFGQSAAPASPAKPAAPATPAKPAAPAEPKVINPAAPTVSIETVRQALAAKVNNHREEIKAKLNELGSPSVTKLNPELYPEMLSFLNSLS